MKNNESAKNGTPRIAEAILLKYLRKHWWVYAGSSLLILGSNYAKMQVPRIMGRFFDDIAEGLLGPGDPFNYALRLALLSAALISLAWVGTNMVYRRSRYFEHHIRNHLFAHWEGLSAAYYSHHSVGDLMAHATNDVQGIRAFISNGITNSVNAFFTLILAITMMIGTVDAQLALYSLIPMPFLTVVVVILRPKIRQRSREVQEGFSTLVERTSENASGIRVVKAYAQEEAEIGKFEKAAMNIVQRTLQLTLVSALFGPSVQIVGAMSLLISLGLGGIRVMNGDLTLGSLIAFNSYLMLLIHPMQQIAQVIDQSQRASAALSRLSVLLAEEPDVQDSKTPIPIQRIRGSIVLQNLSFSYPDAAVKALHGLTLEVKPGQTIGILGHTGSGKSTLASILLRVYDPPRGSVYIDGYDILDLPLRTLRQQIGYVPQDIFLFSDTLRENISFGLETAEQDQVVEATMQAQLYESIMEFSDRFETVIGERGVTLSGGQKQRLALARALIKHAPILILDDSLSAVDTETEAAILKSLKAARGRQTTVLIAHRISTVRDADYIIVLEDGRIVQQGRHESLLPVPGPYHDIYELQKQGTAADIKNDSQTTKEAGA